MKKIVLLLVALFASLSAWAQEGSWGNYRNVDWGSDYESSTEFTINDAADFAQFAHLVNCGSDFEGKTVSVAADLDLSAHYWLPVGSTSNSFCGTFDGCNKTISGLYVRVNDGYIGLFGYVRSGTVKNLLVASGCVEGGMSVGTIVGGLYKGSVTDCYVGRVTVRPHQDESSPNFFGGIVGAVNMGTVYGCHSQATVAGSGWSYGGIVGYYSDGTWTLTMPSTGEDVIIYIGNDTVTGIEDIATSSVKSGWRYNLMGQPVGNGYKGIVVEDGKKILIK